MVLLILLFSASYCDLSCQDLPLIESSFQTAWVNSSGKNLTVSTGVVERSWDLTDGGLVTTQLAHLPSGRKWIKSGPLVDADWQIFPGSRTNPDSKVKNLKVNVSDDEGFTREHLDIRVTFEYPDAGLLLEYIPVLLL